LYTFAKECDIKTLTGKIETVKSLHTIRKTGKTMNTTVTLATAGLAFPATAVSETLIGRSFTENLEKLRPKFEFSSSEE